MNRDYKTIKVELSLHCKNVKFFTNDFFKTFCRCYDAGTELYKNGTDEEIAADSYKVGNVTLCHHFDDVYNSPFYVKNGCAYCEFLQIFNN
jgi:hypothetical protein